MKRTTIQFRIAAWYFLSASLVLAVFATGSWVAMRASMIHSIDRDLHYRLEQVVPYVQAHGLNSAQQFEREFGRGADSAVVGVFVQFTNQASQVLFQSDVLDSHKVPALPPGPADGSVSIATASGREMWPVRVASTQIFVNRVPLTVHLVEPLRDMLVSLQEYTLDLGLLLLAGLILTTLAGYLLSRRALAPVERIRLQSEAIDPTHLDSRLAVPAADDELRRLAQTLNAMLARIESGYRAIQQFTEDASHELRAPLALILTGSEITLRRERSREELEETLRKVLQEARHMSKLVDELLVLARNDGPHGEMEKEVVDLSGLTEQVCSEFRPIASEKGLHLDCIPVSGKVQLSAPEPELRRLLVILLDNAVKYTEAGSITVTVGRATAVIQLRVADTGIGMDAAAVPLIFNRFWRADKARSRGAGGAGLGLSLAQQIAVRTNGAIKVESTPGVGSTFLVEWPDPV